MKEDSGSLITTVVSGLFLADQIDLMHLATASLSDAVNAGETDLFLEQPGKSLQQKRLYLEKLVADIRSPELRGVLKKPLQADETEFFLRKNITEFLSDLEHAVEQVQIIRLTVAIEFKPADIRDLADNLSKRLGKTVAFDLSVDSSLVAGAVIQHGNYITDYSIKSRLARFRQEWKAAAIEKPGR
jgi:F0F1-type ATP synthase delta subunit